MRERIQRKSEVAKLPAPVRVEQELRDQPSFANAPSVAASPAEVGFNIGNIAIFAPVVQRTASGTSPEPEPELAEHIRAAAGNGHDLDSRTRDSLEQGLGANLSGVRVHADAESDRLARSVDARAFTTGQDIFFRSGAYDPNSPAGIHLLAHEAAHTVQQEAGPVAGTQTSDGVVISDPGDSFEQAAGQAADNVVAGHLAAGLGQTAAPGNGRASQTVADTAVQRSPEGESGEPTKVEQPQFGAASRADREHGLIIQRGPDTDKRLDQVEKQQQILVKRQDALELDNLWHGKFNERFASYKQAVLRVTGGLDAAAQNFQNAQSVQAAADQMWAQIIAGGLSIVMSLPMQWIGQKAGGALGKSGQDLKDFAEAFENPANAVVAAAGNVGAAGVGVKNATSVQMPSLSGGAIGFFASNSEAVEHQVQVVEQAFVARATKMQGATDEAWQKFDHAKQEAGYKQIFDQLTNTVGGVEQMKPAEQVARVFERHLWAQWMMNQREAEIKVNEKVIEEASTQAGSYDPNAKAEAEQMTPEFALGGYIEDALNKAGVGTMAGVTLTGHWYAPNSSGYRQKLIEWAKGYKEVIDQ